MDDAAFIELATHGEPDLAREAVSADPSLAGARNDGGVSVVALTVYAGRVELAREIGAHAAALDVFEAACIGDVDRVGEILERRPGDLNAFAPDGFQPLGFAAFFGHLPLLELLLGKGAETNTPARNAMQVCPLHSAAAHFDQARATALARPLLEAGADPNRKQQGGFAPLHEAVLNGNRELVSLLLSSGADPTLRNDAGESARDLADKEGHRALADLLSDPDA